MEKHQAITAISALVPAIPALFKTELNSKWNLPKSTISHLANYFLLNYTGKYFKYRVSKRTHYVIAVENEFYRCIFLNTTYEECIKSNKLYLSFRNPLDCYNIDPVVLIRNSKWEQQK
jgi:hypothetical protein